MKTLRINSVDGCDASVAEIVKLQIQLAAAKAARDLEVSAVEKRHTKRITELQDQITAVSGDVQDYCHAHRASLFLDAKSRKTPLATYGYELTPHRVEPINRKVKLRDIVQRLLSLRPWGHVYVRYPEPTLNKEALLADRNSLTAEQLWEAGVQICQDEQFYIRPTPEMAEDTVSSAAA